MQEGKKEGSVKAQRNERTSAKIGSKSGLMLSKIRKYKIPKTDQIWAITPKMNLEETDGWRLLGTVGDLASVHASALTQTKDKSPDRKPGKKK